jgi:plasmid stability protein
MAKIQARNIDDRLYQPIEESALRKERSIEGEIRSTLREFYQPDSKNESVLSSRECW